MLFEEQYLTELFQCVSNPHSTNAPNLNPTLKELMYFVSIFKLYIGHFLEEHVLYDK